MKRIVLVSAAALLLTTGCTTSSFIPTGDNANVAPVKLYAGDLKVYMTENEVHAPFKVLGVISYTNPGKYQILSLGDVIPEIKEKARAAGANAVIIDENHAVKSGIISTGIGVTARAILIQQQ